MPRSRMHHQVGRLVDNNKFFVFKNNGQIHGLWQPGLNGLGPWNTYSIRLAGCHGLAAFGHRMIKKADLPGHDPLLNSRSRVIAKACCQKCIKPPTSLFGLDLKPKLLAIMKLVELAGLVDLYKVFAQRLWVRGGMKVGQCEGVPVLIAERVGGLRLFSLLILVLAFLSLSLAGCSTTERDETVNWSADRLYSEAKDEMNSGNWATAIGLLQKLESRYPFGRYAQQAQLDTAYAHWKDGELGLALAAVDRFLRLYPNHESVDYAIYLKGLINFNDRSNLFSKITGEDLAERDPKAAREAFDSFKRLITEFPSSRYTPDATARLQFLLNTLAYNDVHVARYYLRRGAHMAAVNRAKEVVYSYQGTPAIEEALAQLELGYASLGLTDLQQDARRVLEKNFPTSLYLRHGYDPKERFGLADSLRASSPGFWSRLKFWN